MRLDLKHGGDLAGVQQGTRSRALSTTAAARAAEVKFPFDYMFLELQSDPKNRLPQDDTAKIIKGLNDLGIAMAFSDSPEASSTIPPVYTYWGQFIDHDITANTNKDSLGTSITDVNFTPVSPEVVRKELRNARTPFLDLDSVYGEGPTKDPEMYQDGGIKLKIGQLAPLPSGIGFVKIPPVEDTGRDLPRFGEGAVDAAGKPIEKKAIIGDSRNDENLIVAQFHLAFLRFHNAAVDWLATQEPKLNGQALFERARQLTTWHYQWLVANDFLRAITSPGTVDKVLQGGAKHYQPGYETFVPLEFSIAAYRFGHSMVRGTYDHNRNFGRGATTPPQAPVATFAEEFLFTGTGGFRGGKTLPDNWPIEWDRFVDRNSAFADRFARKIDTHLAPPLSQMINETPGAQPPFDRIQTLLQHLARRNLLRGYVLSMPTGQAVADALDVPELTEAELRLNNSDAANAALDAGGFLARTPLWYYVLKESEVRENGHSLGDVGSRIVAETLLGLLLHDPDGYLKHNWQPAAGVKLANDEPIVTIGDFFKFAGVMA